MSASLTPEDLEVRSFRTQSDEKLDADKAMCSENWDQSQEQSCCSDTIIKPT